MDDNSVLWKGLTLLLISIILQGCSAQNNTHLIDSVQETTVSERLYYYLYFPEDYETRPDDTFPLLLFLHGGGESGKSLQEIKRNGPPKLIAEGKQFPFLILAPQNPHRRQWWNVRAVNQLLDSVIAAHRVDKKRLYLTGLSRGGGAAWEMAVQYPKKFAAMAVVCGMTPKPYATWLDKKMPIWVFHGTEDQTIPFTESEAMVRQLKEKGYDVRFTVYEGVGHDSWVRAYDTDALYDWFVKQERPD